MAGLAWDTLFLPSLWAPHGGRSLYTSCLWEFWPAAHLQPCATALSGRGHLFSGSVYLAQCNYSSINMSSLQYRYGSPTWHGTMCQGPPSGRFYPVSGFLSEPCQYIPCPLLPPHVLVSLKRAIILNIVWLVSCLDLHASFFEFASCLSLHGSFVLCP